MNGLLYVRQLHNYSLQELADKLGVSNQLVSMWERNKKPIAKTRLKELSELFSLDCKYFTMELSELEKLEVQNLVLTKNVAIVKSESLKSSYTRQSNTLLIKKLKLLEYIDNTIYPNPNQEDNYVGDIWVEINRKVSIYKLFTDVLKKEKSTDLLNTILCAIRAYQGEISDELFIRNNKKDKELFDNILKALYQFKK